MADQEEMNRQILAAFAEASLDVVLAEFRPRGYSDDDDWQDDPDYQKFITSMLPFCRCDYDRPCDGVLAGGPCDHKEREGLDFYRRDDLDW